MLKVNHDPTWVVTLDVALQPFQQEMLDLPVVVDASRNALDETGINNFCVEFYPIVRDFPYWIEVLMKRSPEQGRKYFRDHLGVERRLGAMWRAMAEGFGVSRDHFQGYVLSNPSVNAFHNFLTDIGANGPFASAVAATNYAVVGGARRIATKALEGLQFDERLGERGRRWLETHARFDDEHPRLALDLMKMCVEHRDADPHHLQDAALRSVELLRDALDDSYHR